MTELDLLIDLHKSNPRQGPGSDEMSLKALSFIDITDKPNLQMALPQSPILSSHQNAGSNIITSRYGKAFHPF